MNGLYHNETPPVFWIICLTCFFLSQLKHKCKQHSGSDDLFCRQSDLQGLLALLLGCESQQRHWSISPSYVQTIQLCQAGSTGHHTRPHVPTVRKAIAVLSVPTAGTLHAASLMALGFLSNAHYTRVSPCMSHSSKEGPTNISSKASKFST